MIDIFSSSAITPPRIQQIKKTAEKYQQSSKVRENLTRFLSDETLPELLIRHF